MRVASVTLPFFIGTLRSTRTSTRLPAMSVESIVLNVALGMKSLCDFVEYVVCLAFPNDEDQYLALAARRDEFMAGLAAIGREVGFSGGIGRAHREQSAHRQLAQLAVGA